MEFSLKAVICYHLLVVSVLPVTSLYRGHANSEGVTLVTCLVTVLFMSVQ